MKPLADALKEVIEKEALRCPICAGKLMAYYGKNGRRFNIHHPITSCLLRFEDFGHGETEEGAWQQAREHVQALTKTEQ